jgi:hypothetical protein
MRRDGNPPSPKSIAPVEGAPIPAENEDAAMDAYYDACVLANLVKSIHPEIGEPE